MGPSSTSYYYGSAPMGYIARHGATRRWSPVVWRRDLTCGPGVLRWRSGKSTWPFRPHSKSRYLAKQGGGTCPQNDEWPFEHIENTRNLFEAHSPAPVTALAAAAMGGEGQLLYRIADTVLGTGTDERCALTDTPFRRNSFVSTCKPQVLKLGYSTKIVGHTKCKVTSGSDTASGAEDQMRSAKLDDAYRLERRNLQF